MMLVKESGIESGIGWWGMSDCGLIAVVDGDEGTRAAAAHIASRLEYEICAVESAEALLESLDRPPALAIVEVELPGLSSGLELLRELHERFDDDLPVILVSAERTTTLDRVAGLMLGADDYLAKPVDPDELLARVRRSLRRSGARAGNGNGNGNGAGSGKPERTPRLNLSPREREILTLLADGQTQAQIASELFLSPKTVSTHIQHLLSKLGVHSRAQAVAAAFKLGLVAPEVEGHWLDEGDWLDQSVATAV
jgi:DNA-binding NarL/FixJ family response regulator